MAKKMKSLATRIQPKVTTLKLDSGKHTEIGQETCQEMMTTHFPSHTAKTNPDYTHTNISTTKITYIQTLPWITPEHVRRVLLTFKGKK